MATNSELNYLRDSLAKRRENENTGSVNYQNGDSLSNPDFETETNKNYNWLETAKGWWDNLGASAAKGFFSFFEGVADLGANIASGIGDATGWYDTKGIKQFAKKDFSGDASEWIRDNYAYYNPLSIDFWVNTFNGQTNAENYRKSVESLGDVFNVGKDYSESENKAYYGFQKEFNDPFSNFTFGLAESGGAMVMPIALGGLGSTNATSKLISLGTMGASVAGNESTEAMRQGQDVGTSLLYGGVKGGIEVGSELLTGRILNGLAKVTHLDKAIGKFSGNVGGWNFAKTVIGKAGAKEIGKDIIEEGAEELFSEILDPFAKSLLKDGSSFGERLGKNYSEKEWGKDLALSFLSGAALGGISSFSSRYQLRSKVGTEGLDLLDRGKSLGETQEQARADYEKGRITKDELAEIQDELGREAQGIVKDMDSLTESQKENLVYLLAGEGTFMQSLSDANNHIINERGNVYTVENAKNSRRYTMIEEGNEAIYTTPSQDFYVAMDNFMSESIPADSVLVSSTSSDYATIDASSYRNIVDEGIGKDVVKSIGDAITEGKYEIISSENGVVKAYTEIGNQGYSFSFNEKGNVKRIKGIKKQTYTQEQIKSEQERFYKQISERDFKASISTLKKASRGLTIEKSVVTKYYKDLVKFIDWLSFEANGETVEMKGKFNLHSIPDKLARKVTATIDLGTDARTILETMGTFTDEAIDESKLMDELSYLGEDVAKDTIEKVKKAFRKVNEFMFDEKTKLSEYQKVVGKLTGAIKGLAVKLSEANARHSWIRKTQRSIDRIKAKFTNDSTHTIEFETADAGIKLAHQGEVMFAPWIQAKFATHGLNIETFYDSLGKLYDEYSSEGTEDNPNIFKTQSEGFGYVPEIEYAMSELLGVLEEHIAKNEQSKIRDKAMTANEMEMAERLRRMIERRYNQAKKENHEARIRSYQAEYETASQKKGASYSVDSFWGKARKFLFELDAFINDPKVTIKNMTGSEIIDGMVQEIWSADISSRAFQFEKGEEIDSVIKQFFEDKKIFQKAAFQKAWNGEVEYEHNGRKLTYKEAFWWYAELMSENQENVNEAKRGFHVTGDNGNDFYYPYVEGSETGGDGTIDLLESALLNAGIKNKGKHLHNVLLEFLTEQYNGELRDMYRKMTSQLLGGSLDTNTIEGKNKYFPKTVYTPRSGTGRGKVTEVRPFLNMKNRVSKGGTRGIRFVDAIGYYKGYVSDLANEYYVGPKRDALARTIDVRTDMKGMQSYGNNVLSKEQFAIIDQWIKQVTGAVKPMSAGKVAGAMVTYSIQTPKTMLMQGSSYYVSGIKLQTMLVHSASINKNAMTPLNQMTGEISEAYKELLEMNPEFAVRKKINSVGQAFTNRTTEGPIGKAMTAGIGAVDNLTLKKIALASIYEARDNVARIRGVQEKSVSLKDTDVLRQASYIARNAYQTQISSSAGDKSFLRFGVVPFGKEFWDSGLGKNAIGMLRMYTGAAQGFYSYISRTFGEFAKYHGFDRAKWESNLKTATEEANFAKSEYDSDMNALDNLQKQLETLRESRDQAGTEDEIAEYKKAVEETKNKIREIKEGLRQKQLRMLKTEGQRRAIEAEIQGYDDYITYGGGKAAIGRAFGGALAMGLFATLITNLFAWIKDKDFFKDRKENGEEMKYLTDVLLNSSLNMIPIARTFVSIWNGYDVEEPGMAVVNKLISVLGSVKDLLSGKANSKLLIRQLLEIGTIAIGFNANAWAKYIYGIVERFSPEACLRFKNVFYEVDSSFSEIKSYAEENKMETASYLVSLSAKSSVGVLPSSIQSEIVSLAKEGINALPSALSYEFKDKEGNQIALSDSDRSKIKEGYAKANQEARKLVASSYYKKLSKEQKAKALKAVYQNFKVSAANSVNPEFYSSSVSKVSTLISAGVKNIGTILAVVYYLNSLEAKKGKTKRETILAEIKKTNLSVSERIIALYLVGVSVEAKSLKNALVKCGLTPKKANEISGVGTK